MKRLMIIAGGTWQVPIIQKAKSMGYEVINSNLYENSPGFEYADFTAVSDVRDKEKNLEIAKKYQAEGVLTDQSDIAVPTVAYVAGKIGCASIGNEIAELFTNKYRMRDFCHKYGFAVPEYRLCESVEDAIDFFNELNKKVIIKPLDSQSSRGVFTIESIDELKEKFQITQSYTSTQNKVLIERYIEGTEFTIDGIVVNHKHHSLAISEKSHFAYNKNIANKLFFSYENENFDYEHLRNVNDALVDKTQLPFGITHAEYKYEDGTFYLIEIAARGGGTNIASHIVPYMSNVDNYKYLIQSVLGEEISECIDFKLTEEQKKRCAVLEFLDIESHGKTISAINGVDEITQIPEVKAFGLEFEVGDIVEKAEDDRSRVGYFIVCAQTKEEVIEISNRIKKLLKIEFAE